MLNTINGITGAVMIMKGERQPLHMIEQFGAKIPYQLLTYVSLQEPACKPLKSSQQGNCQQQSHGDNQ